MRNIILHIIWHYFISVPCVLRPSLYLVKGRNKMGQYKVFVYEDQIAASLVSSEIYRDSANGNKL